MCRGLFSDINYILSFNVPYVIFGFLRTAGFHRKTSPGTVNEIDHPRVFGSARCPGAAEGFGLLGPGVLQKNPQKFSIFAKLFSLRRIYKWEVVV